MILRSSSPVRLVEEGAEEEQRLFAVFHEHRKQGLVVPSEHSKYSSQGEPLER